MPSDALHDEVDALRSMLADANKTIAHQQEMLKSFDPELAAYKVHRLMLDDEEAILHQLRTQNWDVALLLQFEDVK